jgi:exopolyphosphatase/pppGpp-phosphohydrolase
VGGTRIGVKCLHAHYAWHLAGGDDPVGRWVAEQLARRLDVDIDASTVTVSHRGRDFRLPVGPGALLGEELVDPDPPTPEQLTNALGAVVDHLDDVVRLQPDVADATDVRVGGAEAWHLATVERGRPPDGGDVQLDRDGVEEVFRAIATESRADRVHNPGLDPDRVDTVVATCCVLVALMRKLHLASLRVVRTPDVDESGR